MQGNIPTYNGSPSAAVPRGFAPLGTGQYLDSNNILTVGYDYQSFTVPSSGLYTIQTQFSNTAGAVGTPNALTCAWNDHLTTLYSVNAPDFSTGNAFNNIVLNPNSPTNISGFSPNHAPYANMGYDGGTFNQLDNVQLNSGTTYYLVVTTGGYTSGTYQHLITETPEPGSLIALGLGLTALARRRRKRTN